MRRPFFLLTLAVAVCDLAGVIHLPTTTAQLTPLISFKTTAATPVALVSHTPCVGGANGATTAQMNATGANFIILNVSKDWNTSVTVSDSLSNTWTSLTIQGTTGSQSQLFYAKNATVGATQTFNVTGSGTHSSICVAAFSHLNLTAPFDQQSGASQGFATTIQPGSLTPSTNNSLVVTAVAADTTAPTVNAPFTVTDSMNQVGGVNHSNALAYSIQTTATTVNPTWTQGAGTDMASVMAVFKQ